jgi:hypothetical protein
MWNDGVELPPPRLSQLPPRPEPKEQVRTKRREITACEMILMGQFCINTLTSKPSQKGLISPTGAITSAAICGVYVARMLLLKVRGGRRFGLTFAQKVSTIFVWAPPPLWRCATTIVGFTILPFLCTLETNEVVLKPCANRLVTYPRN